MEEDHYSKEFDDAPMPHSIFFTKIGHAIHGTDSESRLGTPASHGCVRLSRANASTLYALVQSEGVLNTTVTLTGSSQVALARNPRPRAGSAVARRDPAQQPAQQYGAPQYDAAGDPVVITPQPRQIAPQVRADGYIYPADGSSNEARYPAPRGYRRCTTRRASSNITRRRAATPRRRFITASSRPIRARIISSTDYCSPSRRRRHTAPSTLE